MWRSSLLVFYILTLPSVLCVEEEGTRFMNLSAKALANLPAELLFLVKAERLSSLSGAALAAMLKQHKESTVLVGKFVLAARTNQQREELLSALKGTSTLSERVQSELAAYLVHWYRNMDSWKFNRFLVATSMGSPLLAYLPREFLYHLDRGNQYKFLYHLRSWRWATPLDAEWSRKPRGVRRSWAEMMSMAAFPVQLSSFTVNEINLQGFLLTGATPDELTTIQLATKSDVRDLVFHLPLSKLQARAVFRTAFPRRSSRPFAFAKDSVLPLAPLLTPSQILSLYQYRVNLSALSLDEPRIQPSWTSAKQLALCLKEDTAMQGFLSSDSERWSVTSISRVGRWLYALPRHELLSIFTVNPDLMSDALRMLAGSKFLRALDSAPLSPWHARLLVGKHLQTIVGSTLLPRIRGTLLLGLSTDAVVRTPLSHVPQRVLTHVLAHLPSASGAIFPLYLKMWPFLSHEWALEAMLAGPEPERFFQLLGSLDVASIADKLRDALARTRPSRPLPRVTLSLVLGHWRRNMAARNADWRDEILETPVLLPGLRCEDVEALGAEGALPVLARLGDMLKDLDAPYPRDLQHCGLKAVLDYVEKRRSVHETTVLHGLIKLPVDNQTPLLNELEPAEIKAVGGYILARLPVAAVNASFHWQHVVRAVGRLSVHELLELHSNTNLTELATLALRLEKAEVGLATLELLGNLVQFLSSDDDLAARVDPRAFRLWLEGLERPADTALCVPRATRNAFWYPIIQRAYGPVRNWTAGTLETLGGLLLAVPPTVLDHVHRNTWLEAADQINAHIGYTRKFMQLCTPVLGATHAHEHTAAVKTLMRRLLNASEALSDTVRRPRQAEPPVSSKPFHLRLDADVMPRANFRIFGARNKRDTSWFERLNSSSTTESVTSRPSSTTPHAGRANIQVVERPLVETTSGTSDDTTVTENTTTLAVTMLPGVTNSAFNVTRNVTKPELSVTQAPLKPELGVTEAPLKTEVDVTSVSPGGMTSHITTTVDSSPDHESSTRPTSTTVTRVHSWPHSRKLSCDAVRMSAAAVSQVLDEADVEGLAERGQLQECLEVLGAMDLSATTIASIWRVVHLWNVSVDVRDVGSLLTQVDMETIVESNLTDLDVVTALGRHMHDWQKVTMVTALVLEAHNVTDRMTEELAGALGTLTCGLFQLKLGTNLLQPQIFVKIAPMLAKTLGLAVRCPPIECLQALVSLTAGPFVMNRVNTWSPEHVASLGVIAAGIPAEQIAQLPVGSEASISADAIRCMPHHVLKAMTLQQLSRLSLRALDAITPRAMEKLYPAQRAALQGARSPRLQHDLLARPTVTLERPEPDPTAAAAATMLLVPPWLVITLLVFCL